MNAKTPISNHVAPQATINPRRASGDSLNPFHHSAKDVRTTLDQNQIRPRVRASSIRSPSIDWASSEDVNSVSNVADRDNFDMDTSEEFVD